MSSPPKRSRKSGGRTESGPNVVTQMDVDNDVAEEDEDFYEEEGSYRVGDIYIPPPVKPYCSNESKGARLIITNIMNRNFKSYAGDVPLGPFYHRFHAIIGPNGSGKSNVIDSMLFVFGYRANKIRCKKLSVLIHNSKKHPNIQSCRVAIHFAQIVDRDDGGCDVVPNSEFVIAREAFRNNSSFYTIDDRRTQFKEVAMLLKGHNVDLDHNRFLILQGEVESIAMMKPKAQTENEVGHLEYLEDIIGTTRYKEPLAKIMARVDALTEERTEKHNRCKMAEREMNDLRQPMEEAVTYLKLENTHTRTKNIQYQKYWSENNKRLQECTAEYDAATNTLKEHDDKYAELMQQRQEKEAKIKEEMAKYEALIKRRDEYEQMQKKAQNKYDEIQSEMSEINKRRKLAMKQLDTQKEDIENLKKLPQKNEKEIIDTEVRSRTLETKKKNEEEKHQANLTKLNEKTQPLRAKKEKLQEELGAVEVKVNDAKSELALAESQMKLIKQNETREKQKYDTLKYSLDETKNSLRERQQTLNELEETIPKIKSEIASCEMKINDSKMEEKKLTREVASMRSIIEEKTRTMTQARSNNRVLDYLMKKKREGVVPGVLGRLGDLGGIDAKYDVAVSTSCGRLDNIVVETVETAEKCIELMKRDNVGRATFIALEKIAHYANYIKPIQTPENVPRLFDLIRVEDDRLPAAFYFSMRDTLVATDLEQATRVSYGQKRWRVVSLQGDLIETSGTMSGGGRTQFRGKMGTQVKTKTSALDTSMGGGQEELLEMQTKAQQLQEQVNYLQQVQGEQERLLGQLQQSLRSKEPQLKRLRAETSGREKQIPVLEDQVEQQRRTMERTRADQEEVAKMETIIAERQKVFEDCNKHTKKFTDQIDQIDKQLNDLQNELVNDIQKSIESLTAQITKLQKHVTKLRVAITTSERNVKKAEESIAAMTEEIETAKTDLTRLAGERTQAETDVEEIQSRLEEVTSEVEAAQTDSTGVKKEILTLQKQESDGKLLRVELEQATQTTKKKMNDAKSQLPSWKNKLQTLELRKIPGEDAPEPLKTYTEEELETYKLQDLQYKITLQEEELKQKIPNLNVIEEYQRKRDVYMERIQVLEDITMKRNDMRKLFDDIKKRRHDEFKQGFSIITRKLKEMYQMITQGGDAELELVDSLDPFTEGILFSVRPPRKSWKNISNLSGGEKTLSSLALVFALHYFKPSPLYFMDEIDAALDFKNVSIVANYIKDRTKNAQFIIISLRSNMFELADCLTGIYKVDDCTSSLTIDNIIPAITPSQQSQQPLSQQNHSQSPDPLFAIQQLPPQEANVNMDLVAAALVGQQENNELAAFPVNSPMQMDSGHVSENEAPLNGDESDVDQ